MTMLAVAPPWTTASSINLRRATPVRPIAIGRLNSPPFQPLPKEVLNPPRQQTASAEIPIASDAPPRHTPRGFLPWRFAYAGPSARGATIMGPPSANLHNDSPDGLEMRLPVSADEQQSACSLACLKGAAKSGSRNALNTRGEQIPSAWKTLEFMRPTFCEFQARSRNQVGDNS